MENFCLVSPAEIENFCLWWELWVFTTTRARALLVSASVMSVLILGALKVRFYLILRTSLWWVSLNRHTDNKLKLRVVKCLAWYHTARKWWSRDLDSNTPALPTAMASEGSFYHQGFTLEGERSTTLYKSDFLGERLQSCLQWLQEGQSPVDTVGKSWRQKKELGSLLGPLQEGSL